MDRRVTPPKQVTSPTWGSPPPRKQALSQATNPLGQPLQRDVRCVNDLFLSGAAAVYNGSLGTDDGDGNNNVKKSNSFRLAKQLCTCITLLCTFLCRCCTNTTCKCLISRFVEDGNTRQLSFSFPELYKSPLEFNSKKKLLTFDELNEMEQAR